MKFASTVEVAKIMRIMFAWGGVFEFPVSCGDHIDTLLNSGVKNVAFAAEVRVNGTRGKSGFSDDVRHGGVSVPLGGKHVKAASIIWRRRACLVASVRRGMP